MTTTTTTPILIADNVRGIHAWQHVAKTLAGNLKNLKLNAATYEDIDAIAKGPDQEDEDAYWNAIATVEAEVYLILDGRPHEIRQDEEGNIWARPV